MSNSKRGTGRTTRMLLHAIDLDMHGRTVYVMAANRYHASLIMEMLKKLYPDGPIALEASMQIGRIKIKTPETIHNFDWTNLRIPGVHPNCVVLVDHFSIESHFSTMLNMLTAYDLPTEKIPA